MKELNLNELKEQVNNEEPNLNRVEPNWENMYNTLYVTYDELQKKFADLQGVLDKQNLYIAQQDITIRVLCNLMNK